MDAAGLGQPPASTHGGGGRVRRRLWTAAGVLVRVPAFGGLDGILPAEGLYVDERVYAEGFGALDSLPFQRPPAMYALAGMGRREEASAAAATAVLLNRALREELAPLLP